MKKLTGLFLSVMTLGLSVSSCSSDDDKPASLEGKWEITKVGVFMGGRETLLDYENQGNCTIPNFQFSADDNFSEIRSVYSDLQCNTYEYKGTYKKDGNSLILKYDNKQSKVDIVELTNKTLKIKVAYDEEEPSIANVTVYTKK